MSFQLTIAEGKEAGKEFVFEQDSVLIGRVAECDVVLYDAGISRRHCRIFAEEGQYYVEDMGSSNGTRVNGTLVPVKEKQVLDEGAQLSLGPVVFVFKPVAEESTSPGSAATDATVDENSTRIVSVEAVSRQRNRGEALAPEGADAETLDAARRSSTRTLPRARTGVQPSLPAGAPARPARGGAASAAALARAPDSAPAAPPSRRPASSSSAVARSNGAAGAPAGSSLSAADRARIKRESPGLVANLKLFWLDASLNVRRGLMALGGVLALGLVALIFWLVLDTGPAVQRGEEPVGLANKQIITDSFGLGDGVDWEHPDQKVFEWEYTSATRTLAILHYQAQGISEGELIVTVNGVDLGKVPPDTLASQDRVLEIMIPWQLLKKGELNRITFDNTKNPPGEDPWRVWNIWLERVPLPEISPEQLLEEARKAYTRGRKNMDNVMVGARNGYEGWKSFREAWLLLEAHPEPRPDLYYEARERMKDAQKELDKVCAKLMLEVERYVNQNKWQEANATLDHTREYFPDETDQLCAQKAEMKRGEISQ
ncbi:adenylate cyclase [Cystobacter fuscus]|uniref:Adenylate cyclase n=1 Tax=Cystobacter fuscus TaxID=43 RepID=A0A250IXS8_9BACT|nr:FHA domain-containing protein [Cystobacter fuscus]ATB36539.1 adenylate cyclase [Cystobacter fuscus]